MSEIEENLEDATEDEDLRNDKDFQEIKSSSREIERVISERPNPPEFGLCSKCENLFYQRSKYGKETVGCNGYIEPSNKITKLPISRIDPISECMLFYPKGMAKIQDMYKIATIIESSKKEKIGF